MTQKELNALSAVGLLDLWSANLLGDLTDPRPQDARATAYGPREGRSVTDEAYVAAWVERAVSPYRRLLRILYSDGATTETVEQEMGVRMVPYTRLFNTTRARFQRDTQTEWTTSCAFGSAIVAKALRAIETARQDAAPTLPERKEPDGLELAKMQRGRRLQEARDRLKAA